MASTYGKSEVGVLELDAQRVAVERTQPLDRPVVVDAVGLAGLRPQRIGALDLALDQEEPLAVQLGSKRRSIEYT